MTTTMTPESVTAKAILHPSDEEKVSLLHKADPMAGARRDNPEPTKEDWSTWVELVAGEVDGFLRTNAAEVLLAGWKKWGDLMEAGRITRDTAEEKTVPLRGHTVTLRQHPRVDVKWGPKTLATVHFVVVLDVRIHVLDGIVRRGSLVGLSTGVCVAEVTLETGGVRLGPRSSPEFDPSFLVDLGDGIPLV